MKSLADFKRACTVGSVWEFYHSRTKQKRTSPISKVQSNGVAFEQEHPKEGRINSWLWWPKAHQCTFINNGDGRISLRIELGDGNGNYLLYTKIT